MAFLALLALLWSPAAARDQRLVVETPVVAAPLSGPAAQAAPPAFSAESAAAGEAAIPVLPEAAAPALAGPEAPAAAAASARGDAAAEAAVPAAQGDGASLDDYLAARQKFDNDEGFSNLFAAARQAGPDDRAYVDRMLAAVKGRKLYVDNNTMVFAMNGKPTWLYFFNKVPRVAVVPQVYNERKVSDDSVLKSVAKKRDGEDASVEAARLAAIFRRREQRFMRYMGARLRRTPPVDSRREEALVSFLRANISDKDARVVAEIALSCGAGPCYFLTADVRLAQAVEKLSSRPFRQKLDQFLDQQRRSDPSYPEPRWPAVLSSRP